MVHILFEDSTSGYDVVSTVIRRCFTVKQPYLCATFGGVRGLNNALNSIVAQTQYRYKCNDNDEIVIKTGKVQRGDVVVVYADKVTMNFEVLYALINKLNELGVTLYISNFYCFESVLYSYTRFATDICGDPIYHKAFNVFKRMLLTENVAHYKCVRDTVASNLQGMTAENFATWLFAKYYMHMPCVRLVKGHGYKTLDSLLQANNAVRNCYYNNLCGKGVYGQRYCNKHNNNKNQNNQNKSNKQNNQNNKKTKKIFVPNSCNIKTQGKRGNKANLEHFYKNTLLCLNLLKLTCDKYGTMELQDGKTIEEILC